jgi:hypothetical protein
LDSSKNGASIINVSARETIESLVACTPPIRAVIAEERRRAGRTNSHQRSIVFLGTALTRINANYDKAVVVELNDSGN